MGWFIVNILLPVSVPLIFMKLAGLVPTLPPEVAARTSLLLLVKDGQLGWVALGFSASCIYDALAYLLKMGRDSPLWLQSVLGLSLATLVLSSLLAVLGGLFPVSGSLSEVRAWSRWAETYRVFLITVVLMAAAATMRCAVHYNLSV
ncbi:hypothetical protein [Pseudoduganella aquatica]|uniref:Uncharacterized protein n=1 Tax=Pseudoduganella aquatica TaxID=2660641 RepID=A0A7X4KND0_9BURK|nr:hypothetical protein [Pseudoduganella aquatica]MYN08051.1 hypothetical protein [Pseudoduganella aquatica]